jgi:hypothetical protein
MNDFHDRAEAYGAAFIVGKQLGCQKQQRRADSLAASGTQVLTNFSNGADARDGVAPELALNGCQIVAQQVKNFFGIACGR